GARTALGRAYSRWLKIDKDRNAAREQASLPTSPTSQDFAFDSASGLAILCPLAFMAKLTVNDLQLRGQRVFVRVDYNAPMEEKDGEMVINAITRIRETLPTLNLLIEKGARIILAAHLGRPKGQRDPALSLRPVAAKLADLIHRPVAFTDDCIGEKVEKTAA